MKVEDIIEAIIRWVEQDNPTRTQVNELIKSLYQIKQTLPDKRRKVDRTKHEHTM